MAVLSVAEEAVLNLAESLWQSRKARCEERVMWLTCILILLDILLLKDCETWFWPLLIGIPQMLLIVGLKAFIAKSFRTPLERSFHGH